MALEDSSIGVFGTLSPDEKLPFTTGNICRCSLVLGQKMEHFCFYILLIHLPGDERGRHDFFPPCDNRFSFSSKKAKGIKNSAKCRKIIESRERKLPLDFADPSSRKQRAG